MKEDGGTVFPISDPDYVTRGITLRDYFVGQALAGIASLVPPCVESSAYYAYEYADTMIAERKKEKKS